MGQEIYTITHNGAATKGRVTLSGSKSISNRALIIRALCNDNFKITGLASSKDTQVLKMLLESDANLYDVGPAGTSFRFLTAFLSLQDGSQTLTGSKRMLQRPIGPLVNGLRALGANIEYLGQEGYPPLKINEWKDRSFAALNIPANISSQFISALLLIGPYLSKGLELTLDGKIVSRPYIDMTLGLMKKFGIQSQWEDQTIFVKPGNYKGQDFRVEADWSAASYYYSMATLDDHPELELMGLDIESFQGDSALIEIYEKLGVRTKEIHNGVKLTRNGPTPPMIEYNFLKCPDLAQTVFASCGALGVQGLFSGLETLKIKETDRIKAMQNELAKVQVWLSAMPAKFSKKSDEEFYMLDGKVVVNNPQFKTYEDHRMAMALAPLARLGTIAIEDPIVVEKSYPEFWEHIATLGYQSKLLTE